MAINRTILLCLLGALTACNLGPGFSPPENSAPEHWAHPANNMPVDNEWWKRFNDPELNALVERLKDANLNLAMATERIEQSRAQRDISAAQGLPHLDGQASYTRQKLSDKGTISLIPGGGATGGAGGAGAGGGIPSSSSIPPFNIYQYGFDASWELDLWGKVRRDVEAQDATREAAEEDRRNILLSATAELTRDYLSLRSTQAQAMITEKNLGAAQEYSKLTESLYRSGIGNDIDVKSAHAQVTSIAAQLPPLQAQVESLKNAIALLLAAPPGSLETELGAVQSLPPAPPEVPMGIPSELAHRRPDIRQAEAQLHAATAEIGVAEANFYPDITLTGNGAMQALKFHDLGNWASHMYSFGPSVTIPIFEGGRLRANLELNKAEQREAALQYRQTLLTALHEVDNALTQLHAAQARHQALTETVKENTAALALAKSRYAHGLNTYLDVITAQQNILNAQLQEQMSAGDEETDFVQLSKALGGGWEASYPAVSAPKNDDAP